jgi:hypothetical protein
MADAGRLLEKTVAELNHITSTGLAPGLLDVQAKRQGAPAAALGWANRLAAARVKLDEIHAVLAPLLDDAHADAADLAGELAAEWMELQEAEAEERRQADLDDVVTARVRQRELDRLAAIEAEERLLATTGGTTR